MTDTELTDLGNLAMERCRDIVRGVIQLIETDEESAAVLIAVAVDMVNGAACMLHNGDRSAGQAMHIAVANFARALQINHQRQQQKGKRHDEQRGTPPAG
jgi:hypothetical protein